jgi:pimeloyl-ACP methyl ester carboxylesterase
MTAYTHDTVPTTYVEANGTRFAYRRFGATSGVPLVFFQHFIGNLDDHDPALTYAFAAEREVILFNNADVASSTGTTPDTIKQTARDAERSSTPSAWTQSICWPTRWAAWSPSR